MKKVLSIIVFAVFSVVSIYTITTSNIVAMEMSSILKNQECFVVEGDVTSFYTPTALGHDVESFYIDDVYFEYSNSDEVGYSKTKHRLIKQFYRKLFCVDVLMQDGWNGSTWCGHTSFIKFRKAT